LAAFTQRHMHVAFQRRFGTVGPVTEALGILEIHGYIRRAPAIRGPGRPSVTYHIHPKAATK
jgi:hypothetical protein